MAPEAVVVDTRDAYTFANAADGKPFTLVTARAFAAVRNDESIVATYQVFMLREV